MAETLIQSFLRHAIRDGFFHADMHQGNLFVDKQGRLVAVDFGIMGRLSPKDRRFLAEILLVSSSADYAHVAQVHFDAGYVPTTRNPAVFAQALRAIGEPLMDKTAEDISMARLLTQLFQVTDQFNMQTQPQLLLLQKTMVVVEGVARTLNPQAQHVDDGGTCGAGLDRSKAWAAGPARRGSRKRAVARTAGNIACPEVLLGSAESCASAFRNGPGRRHQARPANDGGPGPRPGGGKPTRHRWPCGSGRLRWPFWR